MARTKQTGKAKPKPKANGTPTTTKATPAHDTEKTMRSPQQPAELSEADISKVKNWLDKQEKPFSIATAPLTKKRKRDAGMQEQTDLFEPRLNIKYEVKPKDKWECLRRYRKFTVGNESIGVGQCILVKHDEAEESKVDVAAQWKAKVLEVRALDSEHVYIRLAWLNRPEDLQSGRKAYHGKNELVPTNEMDIIDAMAVNGSLEVMHWDEKDDDSTPPGDDQYFWRQTYDFANTKTFSELRQICIDQTPQNPDEMILQCDNQECRGWQHVKCIAEAAVQEAVDDASEGSKPVAKKARPKHVSIGTNSLAQAKAQTDSFAAEVFIKGLPNGDSRKSAERTEVVLTDADQQKRSQPVTCFFCSTQID